MLTEDNRYYKVPELSSWTSESGRIIVIGDAAHAMSPTGGQGASMAFEDALTLADVLGSMKPTDSTTADTLRQWQSIRQARVEKILAFTSKGGDIRKRSVNPIQQLIKEWMMWAYFLWVGQDAGLSWIYAYDTTNP